MTFDPLHPTLHVVFGEMLIKQQTYVKSKTVFETINYVLKQKCTVKQLICIVHKVDGSVCVAMSPSRPELFICPSPLLVLHCAPREPTVLSAFNK